MLDEVPLEIILKILLNLSLVDILTIFQVSKSFNQLSSDEILWKRLVKRDFDVKIKEDSWKEEYEYLFRKDVNQILLNSIDDEDLNMVRYCLYNGAFELNSALTRASKRGNKEIFKYLIQVMKEIDIKIEYSYALAAGVGNIDMVQMILDIARGKLVYDKALEKAARSGYGDSLKMIVESIANKGIISICRRIILLNAAHGGQEEIFRMFYNDVCLLKNGSILMKAVEGGNSKIFDLIAAEMNDHGLEVDFTKFLVGAILGSHKELVKKILVCMIKSNIEFNPETIWMALGELGCEEMLQIFLNRGFHPHTAIFKKAVKKGHTRIVEIMIDIFRQTNTNLKYHKILKRAIFYNHHCQVIKLLLAQMRKEGIKVNFNEIDNDMLKRLIINGNIEAINILLDDLNKHDIIHKFKEWIRIVLDFGADNDSQDIVEMGLKMLSKIDYQPCYELILGIALRNRHMSIVKLILDIMKRKKIGIIDYDVLIGCAAKSGSKRAVKTVLELAHEHCRISYYHEILEIASENDYFELVRYILTIMKNKDIEPNYDYIIMALTLNGNPKILRLILRKIDKVNMIPNYARVLPEAARKRNIRMLKILLDHMKEKDVKFTKEIYAETLNKTQPLYYGESRIRKFIVKYWESQDYIN